MLCVYWIVCIVLYYCALIIRINWTDHVWNKLNSEYLKKIKLKEKRKKRIEKEEEFTINALCKGKCGNFLKERRSLAQNQITAIKKH